MKNLFFIFILYFFFIEICSFIKAQNSDWLVYTTSNSGIPSNHIYSITVDKTNNIWIGTFSKGIVKFNGINWFVYNKSNSSLPGNLIYSVVIDSKNNKWIGTDNGLAMFNDTVWTLYNIPNPDLRFKMIRSLLLNSNGDIWIGTPAGLVKYDGINWMIYNTSNSGLLIENIRSLAIDSKKNLWIGTYGGGVTKFDGMTWISYTNDLPFGWISSISVDNNDNIWIGAESVSFAIKSSGKKYNEISGGLAKYDGKSWEVYDTSNSGISDNDISALTIDEAGNKWIGSERSGLTKFNGNEWTVYDIYNSGLPDNFIFNIAIDNNGNKFIATDSGLAVFNEGGIVEVKEQENKNEHNSEKFILNQNYPNPFNPSTTIKYSIPQQSHITLKIYDIAGREIETLINEEKPAGNYKVEFDAADLPSGVYFYRIQAGSFVETRKMILMK